MGKLKRDLAQEMGLWELVQEGGWGALSAKDCGRIGGRMASQLGPGLMRKIAALGESEWLKGETTTNE
ncbi:MAG: small, acid-soluble spore protein, alpha/beta type [Firmicutes bacterium]|nr:small, acid-soluble spore protein, alpha/beta type [Bacillota bacterium]